MLDYWVVVRGQCFSLEKKGQRTGIAVLCNVDVLDRHYCLSRIVSHIVQPITPAWSLMWQRVRSFAKFTVNHDPGGGCKLLTHGENHTWCWRYDTIRYAHGTWHDMTKELVLSCVCCCLLHMSNQWSWLDMFIKRADYDKAILLPLHSGESELGF